MNDSGTNQTPEGLTNFTDDENLGTPLNLDKIKIVELNNQIFCLRSKIAYMESDESAAQLALIFAYKKLDFILKEFNERFPLKTRDEVEKAMSEILAIYPFKITRIQRK